MGFLLAAQRADGSLALHNPNVGSLSITALAIQALQPWRVQFDLAAPLAAATTYLLDQQVPAGGWGASWETAQALLAVVPGTRDASRYADAVAGLHAAQAAEGSWDADVYSTALAVRALHGAATVQFPTDPTTSTVLGVVVDALTHLPLAGATVALAGTPLSVTGQGGHFQLTIAPGAATLTVQAAGYAAVSLTVTLAAGQHGDLGAIALTALPTVSFVVGTLTDAATGQPLAGGQVEAHGAATVTTDSTGAFRLLVDPGVITLTATALGYDAASGTGTALAGQTVYFSPALYPTDTTPVDPTVTLVGQVVDQATLAGALIVASDGGRSTTSTTDGTFTLSGLAPGAITVDLSHTGHQTAQLHVLVPASSTASLGAVPLPALVPLDTTTVVGQITDSASGAPIAGASVTVVDRGRGATTTADGAYHISGLGQTAFTLAVSAVGYLSRQGQVTLLQPGHTTVDIALQPASSGVITLTDVHTDAASYPAHSEVYVYLTLTNSSPQDTPVRLFLTIVNATGAIVAQFPTVQVRSVAIQPRPGKSSRATRPSPPKSNGSLVSTSLATTRSSSRFLLRRPPNSWPNAARS